MMKRFIAIFIAIIMVISNTFISFSDVFIKKINDDENITVKRISFKKVHDGYEINGAVVEIWGTNLDQTTIRFEHTTNGFSNMGTLSDDSSENFRKYFFDRDETIAFTSQLSVGSELFDLELESYPNFATADKKKYNIDNGDSITLTGANLTAIGANNIVATYGNLERVVFNHSGDANQLTISNPITVPGGTLGKQSITINQETDVNYDAAQTYKKKISYVYHNAFSLIENLNLDSPEVFPNTGAKGDEFYVTANNLNSNGNYQVYFVKNIGDELLEKNKADFVSMSINYDGNKDKLIYKVPSDDDFEEAEYQLIITNVQNDNVVAEQEIGPFSVIDSKYLPTIENVYPRSGPQEGVDVQIDGKNLITINIPDLLNVDNVSNISQNNGELTINYGNNATYNGKSVTVTKKIIIKIGDKVDYLTDSNGDIRYIKSSPDTLFVRTKPQDDVEDDPYKDINVEITITIAANDNSFTHVYNQGVIEKDGFMFIPSSITPVIESVVPSTVDVRGANGNFSTNENVLLFINGDKFMVDRYTDNNSNLHVNKPKILIKTQNNQDLTTYDILLDPNKVVNGVKGVIYDMRDGNIVNNPNGTPYKLELHVYDKNNEEVDGTLNNSVGTKIVARLPEDLIIKQANYKNILVSNPKRGSDASGKKTIKEEAILFVETTDVPVIDTVVPNVVTTAGNEEIIITGNNIKQGAKLYINGEEINNYAREISPSGDKILLTFTAPSGPEGKNQVLLQNPSGGIATADFYFVSALNESPVITDFAPKKGIAGTFVIINGENFLKPDPTVSSLEGVSATRLIGTRVFLDGADVNDYNIDVDNNIIFNDYNSPDVQTFIKADTSIKEIVLTPFYKNLSILGRPNGSPMSDSVKFVLSNDGDNNPVLTDNEGTTFTFKYENDEINIYNKDNALVGDISNDYSFNNATNEATFNIDGKTITVYMNNHIISKAKTSGGAEIPFLANYGESVILKSNENPAKYYKLYKDLDEEIYLDNGKNIKYKMDVSGGEIYFIKNISTKYRVTSITNSGFTLDNGLALTMKTPYKVDSNNKIVGKKAFILNRNQVAFFVPTLNTGRGYKDLKVINPDTKYDQRLDENGFYYIEQASSRPKIVEIKPDEGSVDGKYYVKIIGKGFEDNTIVYVDGYEVSKEDTEVSLDGTSIIIKMPPMSRDIVESYGISSIKVPISVINEDGGTDHKIDAFKYLVPKSRPNITKIQPTEGSTNGNEIVEIIGYEFRYFEPYDNVVGGPEYNIGDKLIDLYKDGKHNDLLDPNCPEGAIEEVELSPTNDFYTHYYKSPILPKVYFNGEEAKIVEFDKGFLKVLTPPYKETTVDVYVVNNDAGISNMVPYKYNASKPVIKEINPEHGKKSGQEFRDVYGSGFYKGVYKGYKDDVDDVISNLDNLDGVMRFSDITNRNIPRDKPNSGLINAQRATVKLDGELTAIYNGSNDTITLRVVENDKIYKRVFSNYDDQTIYLPMEMLREVVNGNPTGEYYHPIGTDPEVHDGSEYKNMVFEYIKVEISDKRFLVDRTYAPKLKFDNSKHLIVTTPSYHTVDKVNVLFTNPDGGKAKSTFTYTYPASEPLIYMIKPRKDSPDKTKYYTYRTIQGGTQIEVIGQDFRPNATAKIGSKTVKIIEKTIIEMEVDGELKTLDVLVLDVPKGTIDEVGIEYPILITNQDYGVANSSNSQNILGSDKKPMYFVYQKPLSGPTIESIEPDETSQYGGHLITLRGVDFRVGANVTLGTKGGIPIYNTSVTEKGSKLTFVTPKNTLIPGKKKVIVENKDYGTSTDNIFLDIISYPTIDNITFVDNSQISWLSVEGGQKIKIIGDNFYPGAKVLFGGKRSKATKDATGNVGLFKDNKYYKVEDAFMATNVEVVSQKEMIVTTPLISVEDMYNITILNSDRGISDGKYEIRYSVPVPSNPVGLQAELIDNRYIKIFGYSSTKSDYYEVYYYIGSKTTYQVELNDHLDLKYLTSTDLEPYRLPRIKGLENMKSNEKLILGLKAVNEFGSSDWSNLVYLTKDDFKDVSEFGDPDIDGNLGVPDNLDYQTKIIGNDIITNLSTKPKYNYISIDLSTPDYYNDYENRIVNIPAKLVKDSSYTLNVKYKNSEFIIPAIALNTLEFRQLANGNKPYASLHTKDQSGSYYGYMINKIPRGYKAVSNIVNLEYFAKNNEETKKQDTINGTINLKINYSKTLASGYNQNNIKMYRFNKVLNKFVEVDSTLNTYNKSATTNTKLDGYYILLIKTF